MMIAYQRIRRFLWLFATALLVAGSCNTVDLWAADKEAEEDSVDRDYSAELPRIPPTEADQALGDFVVQTGFRIEQVAAEPLVVDPVAVSFGPDGHLYVVEMRGYAEHPEENIGRVRRLTDTDGDGRFDEATVLVDGLSWPTAIICYDGGVFVGAAPDIIYAKDTDGDGVADERRTVFTGFGRGNVQGLVNSFRWGLDNRIHGATSSAGASITRPDKPDQPALVLRGRDFAFDPRSLEISATSGGAQHGMSFDDWGRKFVSSNSDHIQWVRFEDRYIARNPYLPAPSARKSIASDGPQAEVYRISPVEPWRIVRTRLRVKGLVKGPVEGGGRAAGYFTGATGVTIYRGHAWDNAYRGNAFIGDVGSNIVHRKRLERDGLGFLAHRADKEREFLASSDIWFRPAQFANAPDGTLYVLDVYREVIEHPASLPPVIKQHLDLTSGRDRGRIYRLVPDGFKQPSLPQLSDAPTAELVGLLAHPNGWHRDTAARLIFVRQDASAVRPLRSMATTSGKPLGRLHALYALDGLDALDEATLLAALNSDHPGIREHGVRLSERLAKNSEVLRGRLYRMVTDAESRVRYQLAFSLGELEDSRARNQALATIARGDAGDELIELAVLSSVANGAANLFATLTSDAEPIDFNRGKNLLTALVTQVAMQQDAGSVGRVSTAIEALAERNQRLSEQLLATLTQELTKQGSPLAGQIASGEQAAAMLANLVDEACRVVADEDQELAARVEAVGSLAMADFDRVQEIIAVLLEQYQPQPLQKAAIAALDRFDDPQIAPMLIAAWGGLSPSLRSQATEALLARATRIGPVLDALEAGQLAISDIGMARLRLLAQTADPAIAARAKKLLEKAGVGRRAEVVESYKSVLGGEGDVDRGRRVFRKTCAACHKLEGAGHEIGPNLATIQNRGAEAILVNVLDPNREVNPQYLNYALVTTDGRTLTGMISAETATSITLTRGEKQSDTVLRIHIDQLQSTGLSLMPEGLEKEIPPQAMADVIAYLTSIGS